MRPARDKDERRCKQISRFGLISTAIVLGLVASHRCGEARRKWGEKLRSPLLGVRDSQTFCPLSLERIRIEPWVVRRLPEFLPLQLWPLWLVQLHLFSSSPSVEWCIMKDESDMWL